MGMKPQEMGFLCSRGLKKIFPVFSHIFEVVSLGIFIKNPFYLNFPVDFFF